MGEDRISKGFRIFVVAALAVSILMNYRLITKVNDLELTIFHQSSEYRYLSNEISTKTIHLENVLREVLQEQSWMGSIDFDLDLKDENTGETIIEFQWQVNEYPEGAEVAFHYTFAEMEGYVTVSPEKVGKGMFQVSIPLTIDIEPHWEIVNFFDRERGSSGVTHNVEEVPDYEYLHPNISYYVSMDYDGVMKSSPIKTDYLDNYGEQLYGSIHSTVTVSDTDVVYVDITHHYGTLINQIKDISLVKYKKEKVVGEELLDREDFYNENDDFQPNYFSFGQPIKLDSFTHIVAKVVYDDGKVFEKEIYRK